jgi:25S rRNA (cytosine2278-C5)-methyltransferase
MYDPLPATVHCLQDSLSNNRKGFSRDLHVPDLLLFSPQTTFNNDPLYLSGKIILQDKASCFPAIVLSPPATDESVVIDATAAPGNKTSHLSALMGNKGKVTKIFFLTTSLILSSPSYTHLNEIENAFPPSK